MCRPLGYGVRIGRTRLVLSPQGGTRAQRSGTRTRSIARLVCDPCGVERFFYALIPGFAARPGATGCNAFGIRSREGRRRFFVPVAYGHRQRMWRRLGLVRWNGAWGAPSSPSPSPPPSRGRRELEYVGLGRVEGLGPVAYAPRQRMGRRQGYEAMRTHRPLLVLSAAVLVLSPQGGARNRSIARLVCDPCGVERVFLCDYPRVRCATRG